MAKRYEIKTKLIAFNSASSMISWFLKLIILFWLQRYLLMRVSVEQYSLYPVVASVMVYIELLNNLIASGVSRYVVEADVQGKSDRVTEIASSMFVVQAFTGLAILCLGAVLAWNIGSILVIDPRYTNDARIMMGVLVLSFSLRLALSSFEVGLFAKQRFVVIHGIEFVSTILRILIMILLFAVFEVRVIWVVISAEGAAFIGHLAKMYFSLRLIPGLRFRPGAVSRDRMKELLHFGSWNFLQAVSFRIYSNIDPIILNRFASPLDVTAFYVGQLFPRHIQNALMRITAPLMPSLIGLHATREHDRLRDIYFTYGRFYIWTYMLIALPVFMFRRQLITLYIGDRYILAATVMLILFLAFMMNLGNNMIHKIPIALGRMKPLALRSFALQITNLALTFLLVGYLRLGAIGSALATFIVSALLEPVVNLTLARKLIGVEFGQWIRRTVIPGYAPVLITAFVYLAVNEFSPPTSWLALIGYSAGGQFVYLGILMALLSDTEKKRVREFLVRFRRKPAES